MFAFLGALHAILFLLVPVSLGHALVSCVERRFGDTSGADAGDWNHSLLYVIGLLYLLFVAFFLKALGLPWAVATYAPLTLLLFDRASIKRIPFIVQPERTASFVLWFFVIVSIGLGLCSAVDGIQTAWVNNYGDLAFHQGMIASFIFGDNIPPDYHIFAGKRLSYPFFMNFWTAVLWWPFPDWKLLSVLFTLQWTVVWILVYQFVSGARFFALPWIILLGGGTFDLLGKLSTEYISKGYPWAVFISTIWTPQRTFLIGLLCIFAALWIAYRGFRRAEKRDIYACQPAEQRVRMLFMALVLSIAFICHGHSALVLLLFFFFAYLGKVLQTLVSKNKKSLEEVLLIDTDALATFVTAFLILGLLVSPWFIGKAGIIQPIAGWVGGDTSATGLTRLSESAMMWLRNCPYVVLLLFPLFLRSKIRAEYLACVVIFLLFNFVQIAAWKWDQVKLFISLYVILIALWSFSSQRLLYYAHFLLLVFIVPAAIESYLIFEKGAIHTVYTKEKLEQAKVINEKLPVGAVVAAAPEHHSAVTLSGRPLFMGYIGTLWSHQLVYGEREKLMKSLPDLLRCTEADREDVPCPEYLFWDGHAKSYWKQETPPLERLDSVHAPYLFQIKN